MNKYEHKKKFQRCSNKKNPFICQRLNNFKSKREFLYHFQVPASSFYNMKKFSKDNLFKKNSNDIYNSSFMNSHNEISSIIRYFVKLPQIQLTLQRIQYKILHQEHIFIKKRDIKNIIKNKLQYSFKKCSSTSHKVLLDNHKFQKAIFSARIFTKIYEEKIIVNIDESSF